jgi:hypothetical protein
VRHYQGGTLIPVIFALCNSLEPFEIQENSDSSPKWLDTLIIQNLEFAFGKPKRATLEEKWKKNQLLAKITSSSFRFMVNPQQPYND